MTTTGASGFGVNAGASAGVGKGMNLNGGAGVSGGFSAQAGAKMSGGAGMKTNGGGRGSGALGAPIGGSASAGVSASAGAFAGLRPGPARRRRTALDPRRLIQRHESVGVSTDAKARFRVGGQATFEESSSLSTDTGANADLRARLRFEEK